jgi:hypothetical protein
MAKTSSKKLTKYVSSSTIITAEAANTWYGGLYGSPEGSLYDEGDPVVAGHVHDGKHQDGHAQKVDLVEHVTGQITSGNIATGAVTQRTVAKYTDVTSAIPEYKVIGLDTYYYLDLSQIRDDLAFVRESGLVYNKNGNTATNDFVFGSDSLGASDPTYDARFLFDKSKAAFRAGSASGTEWNVGNRGDYSSAFGQDTIASGTHSSVLGGFDNSVTQNYSSILGGENNSIEGIATHSSILGGENNTVELPYSSILGGLNNSISDTTSYSTILGGKDNVINGEAAYSVAMGNKALAASYGERAFSAISLSGAAGGSQESTLIFTASFQSITTGGPQVVQMYLDGSSGDSLKAHISSDSYLYIDCQLFVVGAASSYGTRKSFTLKGDGTTNTTALYETIDNDAQNWDLGISYSSNTWNISITAGVALFAVDKRAICVCRIAQLTIP